MRFDDFKNKAFAYALKQGCSAAEIYMRDGEDTTVQVLDGELESYKYSHSIGANLRVQIGKRDGYCYTESFDDPEGVVNKAMDNARFASEDEHPMNSFCDSPYDMPDSDDTALRISAGDMICMASDMEKFSLDEDDRIKRMQYNMVTKVTETTVISNTLGLDAAYTDSAFAAFVCPVAEKDGEVRSGFTFSVGADARNPKNLARRGVQLALSKFGAKSVPTGDYKLIFQGKAMVDILGAFEPQFCADNAQKGLSPLADKEGKLVAAPCVNITDDPFYKTSPRPFDGEGSVSRVTPVIREGRLVSLLHNLKTAKKAGKRTTANAGRASMSSPVGVSCSNFVLEEGESSVIELMQNMGNGLLICEVSGLHAGTNPITGDFSLLASGFAVENGMIARPIEGITVASTFEKLLKNIETVGNDTYCSEPGSSTFSSPSVYVPAGIKVSGE